MAYSWLQTRRALLFAVFIALVLVGLAGLTGISVKEDVRVLLPGSGERVQRDFELLQSLPISRQVFIHLSVGPQTGRPQLMAAAKAIKKQLAASRLLSVPKGMSAGEGVKLLIHLISRAPRLLNQGDLAGLEKRLVPEALDAVMKKNLESMVMAPGGAGGALLRADPLHLRDLILPKLKQLSGLVNADIMQGELISKDGRHLLISLSSPAPVTDSQASEAIVAELDKVRDLLPEGVKAQVISGYTYNQLNSQVIKSDLRLIIIVSLLLLSLIAVFYLRSLKGLLVLAAPAVALLAAIAWSAAIWPSLSGIVIGFGAVLLGIAVDYGLHVYFSLGHGRRDAAENMAFLAPPLTLGFVTSFCAFGALLLSGIQGFRQLAEFAMAGLLASFLYSVLVLPQALMGKQSFKLKRINENGGETVLGAPWAWLLLAVCLAAGLASAWGLRLDTDLRSLGYTSRELIETQKRFVATWGDAQSRTMALVQSDKLDEALELNQKLFNRVDETVQSWDVISIAPLLPSQSQQEANLEAWRRFFTPDRVARIKTDLSAAAAKNGFKARAFAAYVDRLGEGCPPVALRDLEALGLGPLLEFFVFRHESKYRVATVLPTGADLPTGLMNDLGVRAVSRGGFSRGLASAMGHEMALLILSALLLAGLALVLFLRSFRLAGLALLPAVSGLVGSLIFISLFSKGLNLFHVATAPLVIGLGADYGIFMVYPRHPGRRRAVWVSGLTTISSFGVLALARHPALYSLGITVLIGVGVAVLCALYVLPGIIRPKPNFTREARHG